MPVRLSVVSRLFWVVALLLPVAPALGDAKQDQEKRKKWENIVQFYGEEDSNRFSLRIFDQDAKEEGQFHFKEVWKYDREKKQWAKMEAPSKMTKVVPAAQKPKDAPPNSQALADLPITIQDVGLYYAKWDIDGIACATYMRLGPTARDRTSPGKAPPGHMVEQVPLNTDKAEMQIIPDPRYFTGEGSLPLPGKK